MQKETRVNIWDLPTRLFHWLLVLAFVTCWYSGENEIMWLHYYAAYALLSLILFRFFWGVWGSFTARFVNFVPGPNRLGRYIRTLGKKDSPKSFGHNPLGALAIITMLTLLTLQIALGLFSQDSDFIDSGPYADLLSFSASSSALGWHETVFDILLFVIAIHLLAIIFYHLYKKQNLILPMISGRLKQPLYGTEQKFAPLSRALILYILALLITWIVVEMIPQMLGIAA